MTSRWISLPLVCAVAAAFAAAPCAHAQPTIDAAKLDVVRQLRPGSEVRVYTTSHTLQTGVLVSANERGITLRDHGGIVLTTTLADVALLYRRERSAGRGVRAGGIAGLFLGALIGGVYESAACDGYDIDCNGSFMDGALQGGAIGAVGGAAIGAGVGLLVRRWRRHWPVR